MKFHLTACALLAGCVAAAVALAQDQPEQASPKARHQSGTSTPRRRDVREVPIDVDEGTWMNVDVSPDGTRIAFDLLGDIYTMPIAGGTPTRIAEGLAWEVQPRFSPDGRRIAFTSDRGGGDNIWVMNADGSDKRQVTKEDFRLLNQPSWSPDGRFIAAKKHFTTGALARHRRGLALPRLGRRRRVAGQARRTSSTRRSSASRSSRPTARRIYYTRNVTPGPIFEYAQDSNASLFDIETLRPRHRRGHDGVSGAGGAVRPTPSPDGKKIAFVRRERERSKLYVKDLASGVERQGLRRARSDVQETWAVTGVYPNMDWTPDIPARGVLGGRQDPPRRRRRRRRARHPVPRERHAGRDRRAAPEGRRRARPLHHEDAALRTVSPDGRTVVFESLGKLYAEARCAGGDRPGG